MVFCRTLFGSRTRKFRRVSFAKTRVSAVAARFEVLVLEGVLALLVVGLASCSNRTAGSGDSVAEPDPQLASHGTVEVTARLVEIPQGAIFKKDLYNYATILKYEVLKVHRGEVKGDIIYVGHYNPWLPRSEAADKRVKDIGGDLRQFESGQIHHMSLDVPIDDFYMGGIVNKYFDQNPSPLYWAVWTDLAEE